MNFTLIFYHKLSKNAQKQIWHFPKIINLLFQQRLVSFSPYPTVAENSANHKSARRSIICPGFKWRFAKRGQIFISVLVSATHQCSCFVCTHSVFDNSGGGRWDFGEAKANSTDKLRLSWSLNYSDLKPTKAHFIFYWWLLLILKHLVRDGYGHPVYFSWHIFTIALFPEF